MISTTFYLPDGVPRRVKSLVDSGSNISCLILPSDKHKTLLKQGFGVPRFLNRGLAIIVLGKLKIGSDNFESPIYLFDENFYGAPKCNIIGQDILRGLLVLQFTSKYLSYCAII